MLDCTSTEDVVGLLKSQAQLHLYYAGKVVDVKFSSEHDQVCCFCIPYSDAAKVANETERIATALQNALMLEDLKAMSTRMMVTTIMKTMIMNKSVTLFIMMLSYGLEPR